MKSIVSWVVMIFVAVLCTSCFPGFSPQNIEFTGSDPRVINTETIYQQNCHGSAEAEIISERSRTVEYTLDKSGTFTVDAKGNVWIGAASVDVGAAVANESGVKYGGSDTITKSVIVRAKPGTNMKHTIQLVDVWKIGNAEVVIFGKSYVVPFAFRYDFNVDLVDSQQIPCDATPSPETSFDAPEDATAIPQPKGAATQPSRSEVLVFAENFESGNTDKLIPGEGYWEIVSDGTANHVYQTESSSRMHNWALFNINQFKDGAIQYRFRYLNWDPSVGGSGIVYAGFRNRGTWLGDSYTLQCGLGWDGCGLNYVPTDGISAWVDLSNHFQDFVTDQWYTVRIDVNGNRIAVSYDGKKVIDTLDGASRISAGSAGFQLGPSTKVQFDDVQVWESK